MKISLNWLKKYVEIPVSDEELVRLIGARLVEVEGAIDETTKYNNIYIVRVESCEKIPDTHLTLCQIDCGSDESVQVVCGAPNVREGMMAVWIAPGATVPASVHEDAPFVIGKRKMRGYESCGMLAGADELDFGDDHSGIVEIDPSMAKPGDALADVFDLNDLILEIENKSLTHRPDCFGVIGFAREVAGILGEKFELKFANIERARANLEKSPEPSTGQSRAQARRDFERFARSEAKREQNLIQISLDTNICPRYSALILEKHGEMKKKYLTWEDTILSKSGMRPVDPIVDATNYLMLLTGQPLHAFDYDKFVAVGGGDKPAINVRLARAGEKLTLLDEKEVTLNENDIVICAGDTPVALAGAMGGKSTAIDENTRKIILESATFSLYNLRKTQMAHGIFSEAITRFTKGQPAYQTLAVAEECAEMLSSGFKVVDVADEYLKPAEAIVVKITTDEINALLGTEYDEGLIVNTLENVGFSVAVSFGDGALAPVVTGQAPSISAVPPISPSRKATRKTLLKIESPSWRTDIHIKEDIIEEVGRLLGYDNIKPTLPLHATYEKNKLWELKKQVRDILARFGANEVLTYSFVSGKLLEKAGQDPKNSYKIVNSISPELQYVRQSIVPSLLDKTYLNEKLPVEKFAIFEMNKVYQKEAWGLDAEKVPVEKMRLGFVVAERKNKETAFYAAKWYAAKLLESLNIAAEFVSLKQNDASTRPFEKKRAAEILIDDESVGVVGEFKNSVKHEFKLADYVAGFEVDLEMILEKVKATKEIKFGARKKEDVTVTTEKTYAEELKKLQEKYPEVVITPGAIYQAPGQTTKNITFHIEATD